MVIDRCDMTPMESGSDTEVDRSPCEVTGTTPDENYYLNVNAHLQLGGFYSDHSVHPYLPKDRFYGCVRNLINNGKVRVFNSPWLNWGLNGIVLDLESKGR